MARRYPIGILLLAALVLGGLSCSEDDSLLPNELPETRLAVEGGDLQATHYRQILNWHGEDHDGEVVRFEYRWFYDPQLVELAGDTTWLGTTPPYVTATRDTFFLPVPTFGADTLTHRFEIRAVDDEGERDPSPAAVDLPVFNQAPRLFSISASGDTTSTLDLPDNILPVLTLRFLVTDPDNPASDPQEALAFIEEIRFWFEDPTEFLSYPGTDTLITLRPDDFGEGVGQERSLHLQAVDRAGAGSNILAASAYVRDVRESRILLLDSANQPSAINSTVVDPFWREDFASLFGGEAVLIHDVGADGPIGDPSNLADIFSLFEAVIWYNGTDGQPLTFSNEPTPAISAAEPGLVAYLEAGGKVLASGFNLVGASRGDYSGGSFSPEFEEGVLLSDSLYVHDVNTGGNNTSNWWVFGPATITGSAGAGTSDLGLAPGQILKGVDRMALNAEGLDSGQIEELYRLDGDATYPASLFDGAVGLRRRFDGGGELVVLTFPVSMLFGEGNVLTEVEGMMQEFGVLR